MYKIAPEPFAKTERPLDMIHYDLSKEETKGGIIIFCVDGRFYKIGNSLLEAFVRALAEKLGWKFYDLIVWAGSIHDLASDDPKDIEAKKAFFGRLNKSIALHCKANGVRSVPIVPVEHDDCGGYGYRGAFGGDVDAQGSQYCADLEKAEGELRKGVSADITVMPFVAMGDGGIYPVVRAD